MRGRDMIHIDGSQGEGGGQILRSSLALSMVTGTPLRISKIRAGRPKPGLLRQHLTCVQAAAAISSATVTGAALASQDVTFTPGPVKGGTYHFPIGTAGGTMLVLQAILPALLRADTPSTISVEGGTHNVAAPPFEFFERALLPIVNAAMGDADPGVVVRLERHGFYPAGGGRVVVEIAPATKVAPVERLTRGERVAAKALAIVSQLSRSIAEREVAVLRERLGIAEEDTRAECVPKPVGPGNMAVVELKYEHITEVFSACGSLGVSAEAVARNLAEEVRAYIAAGHPVGPHLADQVMVPLAVLAGGRFATGALTPHATTNMAVIRAFGGKVDMESGDEKSGGVVRVEALSRA